MTEMKMNGHTVEIYDSIEELPVRRYRKYNKMVLVDSGIGSDLKDMLAHIDRVKIYVQRDPKKAIAELDNMRQNIYLVTGGMSPKYTAFAALVSKIDGQPADDLSDIGLKRVLERLGDVHKGRIEEAFTNVKKKLKRNFHSISRAFSRVRSSRNTTTTLSGSQ